MFCNSSGFTLSWFCLFLGYFFHSLFLELNNKKGTVCSPPYKHSFVFVLYYYPWLIFLVLVCRAFHGKTVLPGVLGFVASDPDVFVITLEFNLFVLISFSSQLNGIMFASPKELFKKQKKILDCI